MPGTEADQAQPGQVADPGRRRAAGIYGAIVTAAIIAAAGGKLTTLSLAVAVIVTLLVYWIAEEYAEILAEHVTGGRLPSIVLLTYHGWSAARASELHGWRLVGATMTATALGLVMVVLKDLVLLHLH